jgi:hypothetical protein
MSFLVPRLLSSSSMIPGNQSLRQSSHFLLVQFVDDEPCANPSRSWNPKPRLLPPHPQGPNRPTSPAKSNQAPQPVTLIFLQVHNNCPTSGPGTAQNHQRGIPRARGNGPRKYLKVPPKYPLNTNGLGPQQETLESAHGSIGFPY